MYFALGLRGADHSPSRLHYLDLNKDSRCMNSTVQLVLESFEQLGASEKREVLEEILRRSGIWIGHHWMMSRLTGSPTRPF